MGLGRRGFLKLSGLALAGALIDPLQAVAVNNQFYVNKKFGIMFEIPKEWGFVRVKDFGKIKEKQILNGCFDSIKEEVWEDLGNPICIATKYYEDIPKYKGIFSPTITLNISTKQEIEELGMKNMKEVFRQSLAGAKNLLKDFKRVKYYKPYKICDYWIYERDATYTFEHIELENPLKVELKSFKIEHNNFLYEFNCHQSIEANQIAKQEFEEFKKSIKLV